MSIQPQPIQREAWICWCFEKYDFGSRRMEDPYVVYLYQPNKSASVHRVSARCVKCFATSYNSGVLFTSIGTVDTSPNTRMERLLKGIPSQSMSFSPNMDTAIPVSSLGSNEQ